VTSPGPKYDAPANYQRMAAEVKRLRGLLARLEWSAPQVMDAPTEGVCPVCYGGPPASGHRPDCWLAAELAANAKNAPPPK
jgi:hypothetical protein